MSEQTEHEKELIRAFVFPQRQRRHLELLSNPKRKKDVTCELAHLKYLDQQIAVPIPPSPSGHCGILGRLKSKGGGDICYVISEDDRLDGKEMQLEDAVSAHSFLVPKARWAISKMKTKAGFWSARANVEVA